jgi:PAS domain S-box-containing protein
VRDTPEPEEKECDRGLFASIVHTPIATVITNPRLPDNPIVAANAAFGNLTGYAPEDVIGRNCRMLAGPETEPEQQGLLRDGVREQRPALAEMLNYRKDGSTFRNAVMIAPVFGANGTLCYFLGSQMAVGEAAASTAASVRRQKARALIEGLTERQRQVLHEMMLGYRNKQIGPRLGINEKTVKMHRAGLLSRLGVPTSADAIRIAVEAEL